MSLHLTPEEHAANPPATWVVKKAGDRLWLLCDKDGGVLDSALTKKAAEALKVSGRTVKTYELEGRWFAGETVPNWKPYAVVAADRARLAAWNASRPAAV